MILANLMHAPMSPPELSGCRATVMGLGTFGAGIAVTRFLLEQGAHVTLTDLKTERELHHSLAELPDDARLTLHLGGHRLEDFSQADLVVVSPAVRPDNEFIHCARDNAIAITTEMNLFWQHNRARVIGVTGSNGKSTTAALIHAMLQAAGINSHLGGNIGRSLLPQLPLLTSEAWVVLELSSFQLHYLDQIQAAPDVAVVTNLQPNHLDWHGTFEDYRHDKQALLRWQRPDQFAILPGDDPDVSSWPTDARRFEFTDDDTPPLPIDDVLTLPGRHNRRNVLAAVQAAGCVGAGEDAVRAAIAEFSPLPHRLEYLGEFLGRRFYNDSLATTPESAIAALEVFDTPIVLLAGGSDKGVDLREFAEVIVSKTKAVALMGETGPALQTAIEACGSPTVPQLCRPASLEEAFTWTLDHSHVGYTILLSPGCASYDWFENFAQRGEEFRSQLENLRAAGSL
ncbi:MAG: UDP-N-acetylmuramoyl-L-alanine--D-glutamate ligase [Planctomycetaceae bacterium]|nr:UDP-N-acetylmuramoyl-L-alanine--D-glutamate ligase [Planctomycetaceae bacterium]